MWIEQKRIRFFSWCRALSLPLLYASPPVCKSEGPLMGKADILEKLSALKRSLSWDVGDGWAEGFEHSEQLVLWERGWWYFENTLYPSLSLTAGTCSGQIEFISTLQLWSILGPCKTKGWIYFSVFSPSQKLFTYPLISLDASSCHCTVSPMPSFSLEHCVPVCPVGQKKTLDEDTSDGDTSDGFQTHFSL